MPPNNAVLVDREQDIPCTHVCQCSSHYHEVYAVPNSTVEIEGDSDEPHSGWLTCAVGCSQDQLIYVFQQPFQAEIATKI